MMGANISFGKLRGPEGANLRGADSTVGQDRSWNEGSHILGIHTHRQDSSQGL